MRLIVTGGGTGGHVFPALEIARHARDRKVEVAYFGSNRGMEASACRSESIPFTGFPSEPVYSYKSLAGLKALLRLASARRKAMAALREAKADVVFGTGGYSAAPVLSAARALKIPYVLHEQNSVPGRTIRMTAHEAYAVATTFYAAAARLEGANVVRTGLPVRRELRAAADSKRPDLIPLVLVVGGSQGARAVNEAALGAAKRMVDRTLHWLHVTGKAHFEDLFHSFERHGLKDSYQVRAFLEGTEMAEAYSSASLVVGRAGAATLCELAAFRLPAVVCPYPHAHAAHQLHNAEEFAQLGMAATVPQDDMHPARLEREISAWLDDPDRAARARSALAEWDMPDAADRIFELIQFAYDSRGS